MIPLWHIEQEIAEEDGEVELTDLDPPGKTDNATSSWFRSALLAWQRSPNKRYLKRYWRLASAPGIVLLLVLLCTLSHGLSLPIVNSFRMALFSPARPSLALAPLPAPPLPPHDGIACLADAAWSPDSHFIAVLGYQDCPKGNYALGLDLCDPGFDRTVLSEFRSRLVEGHAEQRLLDLLLERCQEGGWLKARGRQRTDSTHILAKIRALNRVLCVAQTMVYVLNVLSEVAPEWVRAYVPAEWVERYGERLEHERLLKARRKSGSTMPIR